MEVEVGRGGGGVGWIGGRRSGEGSGEGDHRGARSQRQQQRRPRQLQGGGRFLEDGGPPRSTSQPGSTQLAAGAGAWRRARRGTSREERLGVQRVLHPAVEPPWRCRRSTHPLRKNPPVGEVLHPPVGAVLHPPVLHHPSLGRWGMCCMGKCISLMQPSGRACRARASRGLRFTHCRFTQAPIPPTFRDGRTLELMVQHLHCGTLSPHSVESRRQVT